MWRSASIRTNSLRNCLVNLSGDLAQFFTKRVENSFAPVVLALEFAESKRGIYVSWSGETVVDRSQGFESVVEIGKRFASCLGLKEQEQIIVRKVESVSSCTRAFLDPATPDDWEILQIHASYVENHLLDQVRIVFPGQELPVWINKNTYILIRIGIIEPEAVCARLEEFTEVAIAPNIRNKQSTALSNKQSKTADNLMGGNKQSLDQEEISIHEEPESISSKLYSFVSSLLARRAEETIETPSTKHHGGTVCEGSRTLSKSCCQTSFEHSKIDLCLRVQPLISGQTFSEPSTIFVCSDSFCHKTQLYCKKCNKRFGESDTFYIAKLQKLACPKELNARSKGGPVTAERKDRASQQEITTDTNMVNQDSDLNKNEKDNLVSPQSSIIARLTVTVSPFVGSCIDKQHHPPKVLPGHILVPEGLCKQLGLTPMSLVRLMSHAFEPTELKGLIVQPCKESLEKFPDISDKKILSAFHKWVDGIQNKSVVITNGMVMSFPIYCNDEVLECLLTVLSHCDTKDPNMYCYLTRQTTEKVSVVVGKPVAPMAYDLQQLQKEKMCQVPTSLFKNTIDDLGGINDRYAKCMEHLLISFGQRPVAKELGESILFGLRNGTLLIFGATGSGKTCLAHAVCHQLHQWPVCAHVSIVPCIPLRGKKVETIQKQLRQVFREAAWHQPAVILLDDLDQVISAPSSNQELGGEALYRRRLAEVFKDLVRTEVASGDKVAVIATSRSRETLHPVLVSCRGLHIFQCCVEIAPPDCDQRKEILMSIMKRKIDGSCRLDLSALARKTEGFSSKDLTSLVDRLVHLIALRQTPQGGISCLITEEDFVTTLKGFKPAALRGVSLHSSGDLGWCDVGGLSDVKSALKETLQWPTKYASLFSKCPLRLRSGLLLYGPPGTGKTLMAGVVAKECGLNFISIKGPELLSKYIGASEQAVRDMFIRAQSAKPCILFFDEFDSLAPKRGHDSTGVTDRVVNQLLTQLDGVEGLQGVYILGATSRPDLIDTALLRPGRLDKCLYCGIPNNDERVEILQALSRNIPLAQDVDLKAVAGMCEEFTGADIKALLYNAQLEAIHRTVGKVHLYGDVLGNSTPSSALERGCDATENISNCNGDETCFQVQWPSEREGKLGSTGDEERQIAQQVTAIQESYLRNLKQEPSQKKSSAAVTILQSDLMKTAQSMVPSVSESERRRYNEIYTSFIASRSKTFTQSQMPSHGKATLA